MSLTIGFTIEGECLVGKSSVIYGLGERYKHERQGFFVAPEYFDLGGLTSTRRSDWSDVKRIQDKIIDLEKRRSDLVFDARAKDDNVQVGFDRSILSCLAFEKAAEDQGQCSGYQYLLELYIKEYEEERIILPSQVIHLVARPETIESHRSLHLAKGHRDVPEFLRISRVRQIQNRFIENAAGQLYQKGYSKVAVDHLSIDDVIQSCYACIKLEPAVSRLLLSQL